MSRILILALFLLITAALSVVAQKTKQKNQKPKTTPVSLRSSGGESLNSSRSAFETEILAELNLARSNPKEYARFLEDWKRNYQGEQLQIPGRQAIIKRDGAAGIDDAIAFLKKVAPVGKLTFAKSLYSAAQTHLKDMQKSGIRGHQGTDGSLPDHRLERFGVYSGGMSELIDYKSQTAREVVIKLILDDGNAGRPHRLAVFNNNLRLVGLASGESQALGKLAVIVLAGSFDERK